MSERLYPTAPEIIHASIIDALVASAGKAVVAYGQAPAIPIHGGKPLIKSASFPNLTVNLPTEESTTTWKADLVLRHPDGRPEENVIIRDNNSIAKLYYDGRPVDYMTTAEAFTFGAQLEAMVQAIETAALTHQNAS